MPRKKKSIKKKKKPVKKPKPGPITSKDVGYPFDIADVFKPVTPNWSDL